MIILLRGTVIERVPDGAKFRVSHYYQVKKGDKLNNGYLSSEDGYRVVLSPIGNEIEKDMRSRDFATLIQSGRAKVVKEIEGLIITEDDQRKIKELSLFFEDFKFEDEYKEFGEKTVFYSKGGTTKNIVLSIKKELYNLKKSKNPLSISSAIGFLTSIKQMKEAGLKPEVIKEAVEVKKYSNPIVQAIIDREKSVEGEIKELSDLESKSGNKPKSIKKILDKHKVPNPKLGIRYYKEESTSNVIAVGVSYAMSFTQHVFGFINEGKIKRGTRNEITKKKSSFVIDKLKSGSWTPLSKKQVLDMS